jgi:hypothetical protein
VGRPVLIALALVACGAPALEEQRPRFHEDDFRRPAEWAFNGNAVLSDEELTADRGRSAPEIAAFLRATPYGYPSFLGTYRSNRVDAAQAIAAAAKTHRISGVVLVALVQLEAQLVSERHYPNPSARVELTFRCGCQGERCDPDMAGFDRQIDCAARRLREAFDAAAEGERTSKGWAVGTRKVTEDDYEVKPSNAATAAIYELVGKLDEEQGGAWLLALLHAKYGASIP